MALQAGNQAELLFLRQRDGLPQQFDAKRINPVRLLDEDMLARLDRRQRVERMELRRVRNAHHIGHSDHLLVGVEAREAVVVAHLDLARTLLADGLAGVVHAVHKNVAHGHQARALVGVQRLGARARVAPATADHAHADDITAGRMGEA